MVAPGRADGLPGCYFFVAFAALEIADGMD